MKFKVGDRVKIYGSNCAQSQDDKVICDGEKGEVLTVCDSGFLLVKTDHWRGFALLVHAKQCRKLIKKERKRFWIALEITGYPMDVLKKRPKTCGHDDPTWCDEKCFDPGYIEFAEVLKKAK